ncbi:MAG: signal peptidase I [Bacilli bacterium]|nr:signal peptidase I [Bacilli bacterium]
MIKIKNILKKCATVFLVLLVSLCIYTFVVTDILKKDYVNVFGYTYFVVASGSMSGTIEVDDIIFVKITDKVKTGDIITYKNDEGDIITHRLVDISGNKYITKGDVNNVSDDAIEKKDIIGRVDRIISPSFILKSIAIFLIIFIFLAIVNFDSIIKKYIVKERVPEKKPESKLPDEIFKNSNRREEEVSSGLTVTITFKAMEELNKEHKKEVMKEETIELLGEEGSIMITPSKSDKSRREEELLDVIVSILKCKKSNNLKSRMNKKWLMRYQYVYKLCHLLILRSTEQFVEEINNPPFKEIYDYDLERVGLTDAIRNRIYEMPIYIFMIILTYAILYNDDEMFDGVYKILKYKVMVDSKNQFKEIDRHDANSMKQVKLLISFMRKVANKFDNKKVFELEKIERIAKIRSY